tara:strand:- start:65 stop:589 length:525 start_codon:yes stop_codon:yes gene_type:complete
MKKIFLHVFAIILMFSCNMPVENQSERAPGFLGNAENRIDVFDGNPENLDLVETYIKAHNDQNLELIREMNADSTEQFGTFKIYDSKGGVVNGTDEHIERLSGWFAAENPKWNTFFSYTMKADNQVGEWVITGHTLTRNVDGNEVQTRDILDIYIENGKVGAFWVYNRDLPDEN